METIKIGTRREPFWDDYLIDNQKTTAKATVNHPTFCDTLFWLHCYTSPDGYTFNEGYAIHEGDPNKEYPEYDSLNIPVWVDGKYGGISG